MKRGAAHAAAGPLTRGAVLLAAFASGWAVASVYFAQPLLDEIGRDLGLSPRALGLVGAFTQAGYGLGLIALVPLGDKVDSRRLIVAQTVLLGLALLGVSAAHYRGTFLLGMGALGSLGVVAQLHVAHMAAHAPPQRKGQVVATITTGIITGILLARTAAGLAADLSGWRAIYAIAGAVMLVIAVLVARIYPWQPPRAPEVPYARLVGSVFVLMREEPVLRVRGTLALLIFMAVTLVWTSMSLALRGGPQPLSHTQVGAFGLAGVVGALGALRAGRSADRGDLQRTTGLALTVMLLSWMPIAALGVSPWALAAGVVLVDFGLQAAHVSNQGLIYQTRPQAQSRLTAGYMVFYAVGSGAGSLLSSQAYALGGWPAVCAAGAAVSLAALAWWRLTMPAGPAACIRANL